MSKETPDLIPIEQGMGNLERQLDILWSNFAAVTGHEEERVRIMFASPQHGAGTTTLACCTAIGLARHMNEDVALIESNTYTPSMSEYLGLAPAPGLTDYLDGNAKASEAIRTTNVGRLFVVTGGTRRLPRPGEVIGEKASALFAEAVKDKRYVLIDGPPVVDHPDANVQLELADYIVLVVQSRGTKSGVARRAMRTIHKSGTPVLGVIVNRFQSDLPFGIGAGEWK